MKFFAVLVALATFSAATSTTVSVSYDNVYDNGSGALTSVACSDGSNGLITKYVPHCAFSYYDSLICS
jgi:hypothetical protein